MTTQIKLTTQTTLGQLLDAGIISSFDDILRIKKGGSRGSNAGSSKADLDGTFITDEPRDSASMKTFMKRRIAEVLVSKEGFKTKDIQEGLFGEGRVPGPQDSGRPAMKRTWDLISPLWKTLLDEGYVVKSGRYSYAADALACEIWLEENCDEVEEQVEAHVPQEIVQEVEVDDSELQEFVEDTNLDDAGEVDWSDLD